MLNIGFVASTKVELKDLTVYTAVNQDNFEGLH